MIDCKIALFIFSKHTYRRNAMMYLKASLGDFNKVLPINNLSFIDDATSNYAFMLFLSILFFLKLFQKNYAIVKNAKCSQISKYVDA